MNPSTHTHIHSLSLSLSLSLLPPIHTYIYHSVRKRRLLGQEKMWLSPCINVKLIHVDPSNRKMSVPLDLNMRVRDIRTEPIAAVGDPSPSTSMGRKADSKRRERGRNF